MQKLLLETSRYILYYMTMVVVLTIFFFIFGVEITILNTLLPLIFVIVLLVLKKDVNGQEKICILLLATVIMIISIMVSSGVYEFSVDGNAYHKQAIGLLKDGWNPVYFVSNNYNSLIGSSQLAADGPLFWSEVYPKATWYFAASVYRLVGNIEAGKCYTILFAVVAFGYLYDFFAKMFQEKRRAVILALTATANPIIFAQFESYYLDGLVASALVLLMVSFISEINTEGLIKDKGTVACLIVWGCNLKFSVILFVVTYCIVFLCFRIVKSRKIDWKNMIFLGGTGLFSSFIVGVSPYLTNYKRYGNMFYGFIGLIDEEQMAKEYGVETLSRTGRFFSSIFAKMSGGNITSLAELLKVPFTFYDREFDMYYVTDTRAGGFGVFFSGLFVISFVVIIVWIVNRWKYNRSDEFILVLLFLAVNFIEMMVLPQTSQVRYIPQLYLCIPLAMVILYKMELSKKWKQIRNAANIFIVIMLFFNALPWIKIGMSRINSGVITTATFKSMSNECRENGKVYEIRYCNDTYNGLDYNLKDFNIDYYYNFDAQVDGSYGFTCNDMVRYK